MTSNFPDAFRLQARARLPEPEECLRHFVDHLKEHDGEIEEQAGVFLVTLPDVRGRIWCQNGLLHVDSAVGDAETAYFVRNWLGNVFRHLAGEEPVQVDWEENSGAGLLPPSFSILKVAALHKPTPRMMRITLNCPDAARFDRRDALHVQVLVNFAEVAAAGSELHIPPTWRRYTVRRVDRIENTIDIDVFLHGESGPGAAWVRDLRVGDLVGVAGPSGGGIGAAERFLIAGDETALPAIARIMDLLPRQCHGEVLVEAGEDVEPLLPDMPERFRLSSLARRDDACSALEDAIRAALADKPAEKTFVWVACEAAAATRIRKFVRTIAERDSLDHLIAGYWKR